jgi:preprotein translocase subunit SecB
MNNKSGLVTLSPLHLRSYFVSKISVVANGNYDLKSPILEKLGDFRLESEVAVNPKDKRDFQIVLRLSIQPGEESNLPYSVLLEIVGFIKVRPEMPEKDLDKIVYVNGCSMLYGIMREVIRSTTSQGPYKSVKLPTLSFTAPEEVTEEPSAAQPVTSEP